MDIYELLKTDHDKVKGILGQIQKIDQEKPSHELKKVLKALSAEIYAHNHAEEQSLYTILQEFPETKDVVKLNKKEHERIEDLLVDLESSLDINT